MCSVHLMYSKSSSNDFLETVLKYTCINMLFICIYLHLKYILFYMNSSNPLLAFIGRVFFSLYGFLGWDLHEDFFCCWDSYYSVGVEGNLSGSCEPPKQRLNCCWHLMCCWQIIFLFILKFYFFNTYNIFHLKLTCLTNYLVVWILYSVTQCLLSIPLSPIVT